MIKSIKTIGIILLCVIGLIIAIRIYNNIRLAQTYPNWQTISIEEVGEFKVPGEWIFSIKDNIIYFTDKSIEEDGYKIYLVGSIWFLREDREIRVPHILFEDVEYIGHLDNARNQGFSNSAYYSQHEYRVGDEIISKYHVNFSIHKLNHFIEFVEWDYLMDEDTLIKIAKSFIQPKN